jgi:hypothetical protein
MPPILLMPAWLSSIITPPRFHCHFDYFFIFVSCFLRRLRGHFLLLAIFFIEDVIFSLPHADSFISDFLRMLISSSAVISFSLRCLFRYIDADPAASLSFLAMITLMMAEAAGAFRRHYAASLMRRSEYCRAPLRQPCHAHDSARSAYAERRQLSSLFAFFEGFTLRLLLC